MPANLSPYESALIRLNRLGKTKGYLAARLKRSRGAVSQAFSGKSERLFGRIVKHIEYLELQSKDKEVAA